MWFNSLLITVLVAYACINGCQQVSKEGIGIKSQSVTVESNSRLQVNLAETNATNLGRINEAHFLDPFVGWATNEKYLYITNNGGRAWQSVPLNLQTEETISSMFFINYEQGWVAVNTKRDVGRYGLGNSSSIFSTTDGGKTWVKQAIFQNEAHINRLKFRNAQEGIAIGYRMVDSKPVYGEMFVIRTKDGGQTWEDLSQGVNAAIKNKYGVANDYGTDFVSTSTEIYLLTIQGKVISSSDDGANWQTAINMEGIQEPEAYIKINADSNGNIKIIGGSHGDEGYWGSVLAKDTSNSLTRYVLTGTPITDAVFLDKNEIVACGSQIQNSDSNVASKTLGHVGVIVHSTDGGKTWTVLYHSARCSSYISITKVSNKLFYVVGDTGAVVQITL